VGAKLNLRDRAGAWAYGYIDQLNGFGWVLFEKLDRNGTVCPH
jgi:hypothetical protein